MIYVVSYKTFLILYYRLIKNILVILFKRIIVLIMKLSFYQLVQCNVVPSVAITVLHSRCIVELMWYSSVTATLETSPVIKIINMFTVRFNLIHSPSHVNSLSEASALCISDNITHVIIFVTWLFLMSHVNHKNVI